MLNTASTRLHIKDVFDFIKFLFKRRRKYCMIMNKKIREIRIKKTASTAPSNSPI